MSKRYMVYVNGKDLATYPVTQNEIWKEIPGYEGLYETSSCGRIRSLDKKRVKNFGKDTREYIRDGKILKGRPQRQGYLTVALFKNGKRKDFSAHRLIGQTFLDNPNGYETINHKNGIKSDNNISNLEWCTQQYNSRHSWDNGLNTPNRGEHNGSHKLSSKDVVKIKMALSCSILPIELARMFNVHKTTIKSIRSGRLWKHIKLKTL